MSSLSSDFHAEKSFIAQQKKLEYFAFPKEVDQSYSYIINWLSTLDGMEDFDTSGNLDLDSDEWLDTGRQVSRFLPSHTMKVYQSLLQVESNALDNQSDNRIGLLGQPNILILDNGCGGGTATLGLIMLISNYQKYRFSHHLPLYPVALSCIGIDPNEKALIVYGKFIEHLRGKFKHLLIDIGDVLTLPGTLPENSDCMQDLLANKDRAHCVFLALSNLIRPLTSEYQKHKDIRQFFERFGMEQFLPSKWRSDIGSREIDTLRSILDTNIVDQIILLLISAHSTRNGQTNQSWKREMKIFQRTAYRGLSESHSVHLKPVQSQSLKMANPPASFHHKKYGHEKSDERVYDSGFAIIYSNDYLMDSDWRKVLDPDNLLLAWARVRNALSYEALEDTIEIRLFDMNVRERLTRLRCEVLAYQWDVLKIAQMLNFHAPKGPQKKPRPLTVCRLEDQILATAILQVKSKEYSKSHSSRSYAYTLADGWSEHLYEHWFEQHQRFVDEAREVAADNLSYQVIQTDLSSFYTHIVQSDLLTRFQHQTEIYNSRNADLSRELIERDCQFNQKGFGIPQGHIVSGALANVYLSPVDHQFAPGNQWGIEYFRFVDDMILMFPPSIGGDQVLSLLDQALEDLQVPRSRKKTVQMSAQEFLERTEPDELLEALSKEHNFLLADLYKITYRYTQVALDDWWAFVQSYQRLLMSIGVFVGIPRLSRKLRKNLGWWRRILNSWARIRLPRINGAGDLQKVEWWQSEFKEQNSSKSNGWVLRRERLADKLTNLLTSSLKKVNSESPVEQSRAYTRLKFALYRLGQLGFGNNANTIASLLEKQPWLVSARRVCHSMALQGYEDLLISTLGRIWDREAVEWSYVRATILKSLTSLPKVSESTISLLQDVCLNGKTMLEKTMASETLFLLRKSETLEQEVLVNAIRNTEDGYLAKNYALLYAVAPGDHGELRANLQQTRILNETLEYIRVTPHLEELHHYEPNVLIEEFYEGEYTDGSEEFESFGVSFCGA